jgi:hypothetical protein
MRLKLSADDEVGLLVDERCGFSMSLPGHPYQTVTLQAERVPRHDARVVIKDVPVEVRLRLDSRPEGIKAAPLASALVQSFASVRSRSPLRVTPAREAVRRAWGVEAAASALYSLSNFDPSGADTEEVLVLVHAAQVMTVTRSFPGAFTDNLRWTLFNSASNSSLRWAPDAPSPREPASLWPQSTFLLPGVLGLLRPERRQQARDLGQALDGALLKALSPRLETLLYSSEPPTQEVEPSTRRHLEDYLLEVAQGSALEGYIKAEMPQVRCAQDTRGLALVLLLACGQAASRACPGQRGVSLSGCSITRR